MLLIISGPSGVGKSRLLDVAERAFGFRRIVPLTTRSCRPSEVPYRDYQFVSRQDFRELILNDHLTAWDYALGNYYGYTKDLAVGLNSGQDIVIQALSRMAIRIAAAHSNVLLVSLRPSSDLLLESRLAERKHSAIDFVLRRAHWDEEVELSYLFNVVIDNADVTPTSKLTSTLADVINGFS